MKKIILVFTLISIFIVSPTTADPAKTIKNIILLISDGCGYNHIEITDYYQYGKLRSQVYEKFPVILPMTTYSASGYGYDGEEFWLNFDYGLEYATDSSAAVTAMATGEKTLDGMLNVLSDGTQLKIITEYAQEMGKSTGTISSVHFTNATPAGFGAHNESRNNFIEIAQEMLLDSKLTVVMGAGHPYYDNNGDLTDDPDWQYVGGEEVFEGIFAGESTIIGNEVEDCNGDGEPDIWTAIQDKSEFQALMNGDTPMRVFGLAQVATTLQEARSGGNIHSMPYDDPFNDNVPTLEEMTIAALNVLDNNPDGFFLHIEGGAVDWASHEYKIGRMIEEEIDFNDAVDAVVEWVKKNSNWHETLVIVTGDHETGYIHGPGSNPEFTPIVNNGQYQLPGLEFYSWDHSNSLVPLFTKGGFSKLFKVYATDFDPVRGAYIDNTDVFKVCLTALAGDYTGQLAIVISELIENIHSNENLKKGIKKSSIKKLENVLDKLAKGNNTAAINQLVAYINQITPQQGKGNGKTKNKAPDIAQNKNPLSKGKGKHVVPLSKVALAETYTLSQNTPNPFNPYTTIEYVIPSGKSEYVSMQIFDIRGALVRTLVDQVTGPGIHSVMWDGADGSGNHVSSGIYIYRLQAGKFMKTRKMMLMR